MTAPRPIPDKVRRIIPTLGSPVDGEALGAARAIGRVLQAGGASYYDLAAAIPAREPEPGLGDYRPYRRETWSSTPRPARWGDWRGAWVRDARPRKFTPIQEARQEDMAAFCRSRTSRLSDRERAFVNGIAPERRGLSIRQGDWLADICSRLEHEGRDWWQ
ncbi:hypothetical protein [Methylobacterium thuringiense]|uniref:Uncharacterized protein n=1 Tax=Methylobacterium thuringiense TaxID=1003091 RepID=A0ABQ4TSH0_9HYPH|nr:hypothetical protein [Methylobacterium thuringiense]GJE57349.1 hypothetical protein EKPJFOCH_3863 [Methylobacterium thuringiense]